VFGTIPVTPLDEKYVGVEWFYLASVTRGERDERVNWKGILTKRGRNKSGGGCWPPSG
jgi:hypothetical protein